MVNKKNFLHRYKERLILIATLFVLMVVLFQVYEVRKYSGSSYKGTLKAILKKKTLRVLTTESSFNYFIYQGKQSGYEYDMAKAFVDHINKKYQLNTVTEKVKLKIIPTKYDKLFKKLSGGEGDIIAAGTTGSLKRSKVVDFSDPYNLADEIVVSHKKISLKKISDLQGKTIHLRQSSSYFQTIKKLNAQFLAKGMNPVVIELVNENLDTETILELVSLGKYEFTVADSHLAFVGQKVFGNLHLHKSLALTRNQPISWAIQKKSNPLKKEINMFLVNYAKGTLYGNMNIKKYYKNIPQIQTRYFSKEKNRISPYDDEFKKYGKKYGWDWRLLAALAYQESRFRQNIKNKWGAIGVMQIKRQVASEPYVGISNIEGKQNSKGNIQAGVKYLSWLKKTYFDSESIEPQAQIHLTLAAYNAGPGRIKQARKKASELGLDPNLWFGAVEHALLEMNLVEPVKYVEDIHRRTIAYSIIGL